MSVKIEEYRVKQTVKTNRAFAWYTIIMRTIYVISEDKLCDIFITKIVN